jgi:hypothetical protein
MMVDDIGMHSSAQRLPMPDPEPSCVNCGAELVAAYCAGCGQRTPAASDYSLRTLGAAAIGHLTNYDGRLWSTVRKLFLRPGQLARDHFEGRRAQHLDPFRIFVLSNLVAWFVVPHTHMFGFSLKVVPRLAAFPEFWARMLAWRAGLAGVGVAELARRIDAISSSENSVAVLCLVPFAAAGFAFVQHLVFTAHFYCIHLLCVLVYLGFVLRPLAGWCAAHALTAPLAKPMVNIWWQHLGVAPALIAYLYFGLQRAYRMTPRQSSWRAVVLGLWACTVTRMFFDVAFAVVLVWA